MSKNALEKFITEALPDKSKCIQGDTGFEVYYVGNCLHNVGVYTGDGRDKF